MRYGANSSRRYKEEARTHKSVTQKKVLMTWTTTMGLVTHLEPDILEHEVKWVEGNITTNKACRGDSPSTEFFKMLL